MRPSRFAPLLGFQQIPLREALLPTSAIMPSTKEFGFKTGPDVFSPKEMIELARPGVALANPAGDLILTPVSKYTFEEKKYVYPS